MSSGDELAGGGGREVMVFPQFEMKQPHRRQGVTATTSAAAGTSVDVRMEKRAQKFLLFIIVFHFVCWLPLNVLK